MFQKIGLQISIKDMALWNSEVKKMLIMYGLLFIFAPHNISYAISSMIDLLNMFILMQAIKVLNMIKLYGKPIRVNKVHSSFISCFSFFHLPTFLLQYPILFFVRFTMI